MRSREAVDRLQHSFDELLSEGNGSEPPSADVCLNIAAEYRDLQEPEKARLWAARVVDSGDDFLSWLRAGSFIERLEPPSTAARRAKLALLGSYTTVQFRSLLKLAGWRAGVALEIYESPYGQYQQEILNPASSMFAFAPDLVLFAVHEGEARLSASSNDPEAEVEREAVRWNSLWVALRQRSNAIVIQHNFVVPAEPALGHLAAKQRGSRYRMLQQLNMRLADTAPDDVAIVDCDRVASEFGKTRWFDPRYWYMARQGVSLAALPALARHTARVIAGALGLAKKCAVLDLDNTLWGGVIGEDQIEGIQLGEGSEGEAYTDFQDYLLELRNRGVILAVCSKNNEADAREAFASHPRMRLRLGDFAAFVCNWENKPDNLRRIANSLNIGLDSLVMIDDNPAERQYVRQLLPEVEVPYLPSNPALYRRAISTALLFETPWYTAEDSRRAQQYQAQARAAEARSSAASLEEFYRSLEMEAWIAPFNEADLPRIAQLVCKTNQFNLTTVRHTLAELREFMRDPACITLSLRLRDRYGDHGLVAVLVAQLANRTASIRTWLMSCRVLGREVERHLLRHLCLEAARRGCETIAGTYIATPKNVLVKDLYARLGFSQTGGDEAATTWEYDLRQGAFEASAIRAMQERS